MSTQVLNQIIQQVELLNEKEINQLNHYLNTKVFTPKTPQKWHTIRGLMPYSENTEDAQIVSTLNLRVDMKFLK